MRIFFLAASIVGVLVSGASAQQSMRGVITKVDEPKGIISIQQSSTVATTSGAPVDDFKVQDGLMFNALQSGDKVQFTIETMNGAKTITKLTKE